MRVQCLGSELLKGGYIGEYHGGGDRKGLGLLFRGQLRFQLGAIEKGCSFLKHHIVQACLTQKLTTALQVICIRWLSSCEPKEGIFPILPTPWFRTTFPFLPLNPNPEP